jgi:type III restriction enzyme
VLSASLDLATGTGKSYVLYGIATILLAERAVDRVLVLCPSTTIEAGLLEKFRELAATTELSELLPASAAITTPHIDSASSTITAGSICVENYHAILEHVGSSVRDSLLGRGDRVAVLNDEAHHVANDSATKAKRWKEFLANPDYGFRYVVGVSGTCYVGDDYFADVVYRFSLREAMEQRYVKKVEYVADMPKTRGHDEKWQLIRARHEDIKRRLKPRNLLPLTIVVTPTIARCNDVADELKAFLVDTGAVDADGADEQVLVVHSDAPDLARLRTVDVDSSRVEWIVSVSMLTEGWDVKRVFQIVPHEERAFNSKLLISQVLGRGLRVPEGWTGAQPEVTVFNHDAWAGRIRHLVTEVLEVEKRISCSVDETSPHHFALHNIEYTLDSVPIRKPVTNEYELFAKGYIDLAAGVASENVEVEFERAATGERHKWQARIERRTYSAAEVAAEMFQRLHDAEDAGDPNAWPPGTYTKKLTVAHLEAIVRASLDRVEMSAATESVKQKFLQSLGPLRRRVSETIRYTPVAAAFHDLNTRERPQDSVSASDLRRDKVLFFTDGTRASLHEDQREFLDEIAEPGSPYRSHRVDNRSDFKTPVNAVIADADPERRFITTLLSASHLPLYDAWLKSTSTRFYEIAYTWKKGEHPKRGRFSPDFFIKAGDLILVVEIKGDEEMR